MHMAQHTAGLAFHQSSPSPAISVADDSTVQLTSGFCGAGWVLIWEGDRGYNGYSNLGYNGASGAGSNYGTFAHSDSDGAHCVYNTGAHNSYYKNRTGATRNIQIIIYGSRFS